MSFSFKNKLKVFIIIQKTYRFLKTFLINIKYLTLPELLYYLKVKGRKRNNTKIFRKWIKKAIFLQKIKRRPQFHVEYAFYLLKRYKKDKSLKIFNKITNNFKAEKSYQQYWFKSFEIITDGKNKIEKNLKKTDNPAKKIFISGMGWSGSGAVFDYLKEYNAFYSVEKEFSHLSRGVSIKTVLDNINKNDFQNKIIDLFKYTLFSTGVPETGEEARAVLNNIFIKENYAGSYAENNYLLLNNLYWLSNKKNSNEYNIKEIVTNYLDSIINSLVTDDKNFVLLNNVVTIQDLLFLNYIEDHYTLCSVRDPRATYVSKSLEKRRSDIDVNDFINEYRSKRKHFEKIIGENLIKTGTVVEVQFEEFVLSEELRKKVYRKLDDSDSIQNKYLFFKPWKSEKNIDIYKHFSYQHRIKEIEEKLPEYLWN